MCNDSIEKKIVYNMVSFYESYKQSNWVEYVIFTCAVAVYSV